ncbi:MAG: DNA recombination protein RmuC [Firmicutes bacterium ADurb.Bin080]|jgi:DNA recombination protein RmuC|nr:DNA recombination protein RmuC [Clostridiales bacterium]OQC15815.1 MAG: DNA recombination protein RmuC [Firmicutes bacterium ADurb.Bin080]
MELALLIISIILCVASLIVSILIYLKIRTIKGDNSAKEGFKAVELQLEGLKGYFESFSKTIKAWTDQTTSGLSQRLLELQSQNTISMEALQKQVKEELKELREGNEKQLDQMRNTVDEKMTKTLNERIEISFKSVTDRLQGLHEKMGEMNKLSTGITDLSKLLSNSKTRGNWGEANLEMIMEDILTAELYEKQFSCGSNKKDAVDFAIKLPGEDGINEVYLPIDSKFPTESYVQLVESRSEGDKEKTDKYLKELRAALIRQAKSISSKYINVPKTTDFAIMFLPSEGLYAETMSISGLGQEIQKDYKVVISGPTTISALLQSLRIGFKTLQIQKNSADIVAILKGFSKDFDKFVDSLSKTKNQLDTVSKSINDTYSRSGKIKSQLENIGRIGGGEEEISEPEVEEE